jgi:hypothetical protein
MQLLGQGLNTVGKLGGSVGIPKGRGGAARDWGTDVDRVFWNWFFCYRPDRPADRYQQSCHQQSGRAWERGGNVFPFELRKGAMSRRS